MRYVCATCSKEMRCSKTGCDVVWNNLVVSRCDEYKCPACGTRMRVCNPPVIPYMKTTPLDAPITVMES